MWTPITGIVDPESPARACLREAQEEANVQIEVLELAQVKADPAMQFGNGDQRSSWIIRSCAAGFLVRQR